MSVQLTEFQGQPALRLRAPDGAQATVLLHGAHLVSWIPAGGQEQLYLSPTTLYGEGRAVRGGVPVVFPQFNMRGPLAAKHGLSRRQMERLFHDRLKTSPAAKLRDIRIDQAHSLISETDMSMMEIAVACGFQSQAALRKAYRQRFGVVPSFKMRKARTA